MDKLLKGEFFEAPVTTREDGEDIEPSNSGVQDVSVFLPSAGSHTQEDEESLVGGSVEANPEDAGVDSPSPPPSQERKSDCTRASQELKTPEPYQHKVVGLKYGLRKRTTPPEQLMFVTLKTNFLNPLGAHAVL